MTDKMKALLKDIDIKTVTSLDLSLKSLTDEDIAFFNTLEFPALEILNLNFNKITTPPKLDKCKKLVLLNLYNNYLTTPPKLDGCKELKRLDLSNNYLTTLPKLDGCKKLERLYLNNNYLTTKENNND